VTVVLTAALVALAGTIGWVIRDRAAQAAEITRQVQDSLRAARALMAENQPVLARQKLAEANVLVGKDREAFAVLAAEVEAFEAYLDNWRRFLDLVDKARQAEILSGEAQSPGLFPVGQKPHSANRQPARAVPYFLQALACYEVLEREDWSSPLEHGLLRKDHVDQIRRTAYEVLLWLATDLVERREDHASAKQVSPESAARLGLAYLRQAERCHPPTQVFYQLRANCQKTLGQEEAARADRELARETPPTMAFDYYQRGQAAYNARNKSEAIKAFEAGLRLEPTHYQSMIWLGSCFCDLGKGPEDFSAAVLVFGGCIMRRPDATHAYYCRGLAFRKLGRLEDTLADFSKAIELDPKFTWPWSSRGSAYNALRLYDKALADLTKAIELDPKHTSAWSNRGVAYFHLRQYDKALADLNKAIELDPKNAAAWSNRASFYNERRQYAKALADSTKAIELDPKYTLAWSNRGAEYIHLRQYDKALADLTKAIELDPEYAKAWANRSAAYSNLRQYDKALADASKAIELDPKNAVAWNNRAMSYMHLGPYTKVLADLNKAIELDPKYAPAWANRSAVYIDLRQYDKALADSSKAIELDPKNTEAARYQRLANQRLQEYDKALVERTMAIEQDPKNALAWFERGKVYHELRQYDKALADLSKAIELDPKKAPVWYFRGSIYNKRGAWDKAVADFSKVVELDARDAVARSELAWLFATCRDPRMRNSSKAVVLARQAVALAPKKGFYWSVLGVAEYRAGNWRAAIEALTKSADMQPQLGFQGVFLAMAHWQLGNKEQARTWFDQATRWRAKHQPNIETLEGFYAEAAKLLGIEGSKN
jgi:tetratricopeptide (TPR) repeat protein